jgi:transposase
MKQGLKVRLDITAAVLRKKARSEKDGRVVSRLFGIANILDGMDRDQAARLAGMTRQTLRDWVRRYNTDGIEGLRDLPKGHTQRALKPEQEKELEALVLKGPQGTLVRWRRVDLRDVIKERYGVAYHERSVGKILKRLGFSHLSVRPMNPEANSEDQEAFKKTLRPKSPRLFPRVPEEKRSSFGSRTKHA